MDNQQTHSRGQYLQGAEILKAETRQLPPFLPDEVRIQIRSTTLCGSDIHYFKYGKNGSITVKEPLCGGHESAGEVVAVGQVSTGDGHLQVGDKVAIESGVPCGDCDKCTRGRYNVCSQLRFRSSGASFPHFQGTLQEYVHHPARWCHKLPETMSCDDGAILEPLSVSIHAVRRANMGHGSTCLVLGAGAVGLLCAAVAKIEHQCRVIIADIDPGRVQFATSEGFADVGFTVKPQKASAAEDKFAIAKRLATDIGRASWPNGGLVGRTDFVFECTGVESCVQTSFYAVDSGGKVVLVGMGTPTQSWPISEITGREVDVVSVWRYAHCYPRAIEIMNSIANGEVGPDVRKLITHRFFGLGSIPAAYGTASQTRDENGHLIIKAVVNL